MGKALDHSRVPVQQGETVTVRDLVQALAFIRMCEARFDVEKKMLANGALGAAATTAMTEDGRTEIEAVWELAGALANCTGDEP